MDSTTSAVKAPEWWPERYEFRGLIGQGGMGKVFRAYDPMLNRDVAIKLLDFEGNNEQIDRFLREAKALATLDHPNIVQIFGSALNSQGQPYHVIEFLDGDTLADELKKGSISAEHFRRVISNILAGLQHAHQNKVFHRDLKPSNIIRSKDNDAHDIYKIIDFGIARIESGTGTAERTLTATNTILGSPAYMSPEQCRGARGDALSDIYALGCIMYECVAGKPPFQSETTLEVMYKHMNETPAPLAGRATMPASKGLADLIESCLKKQPEERPQSAADLAEKLNVIFDSNITRLDLFSKKAQVSRKSPGILIIAAVGVVSLLVAFGAYSTANRTEKTADQMKSLMPSEQDKLAHNIAALKAKSGKNLNEYFALGRNEIRSGSPQDLADAVQTYTEALALCKPDGSDGCRRAACLTLRGKAEWMQDKNDAAGKDFNEAVAISKKNPDVWYDVLLERARFYAHIRKFDEALLDYKEVAKTYTTSQDFGQLMENIGAITQHLDKGGDSRAALLASLAADLRKTLPMTNEEKVGLIKLLNAVGKTMKDITLRPEDKTTLYYSLHLANTLKGHDDLREETKQLVGNY